MAPADARTNLRPTLAARAQFAASVVPAFPLLSPPPSLVQIGELVLKRVINQFNRAYRRHDKVVCNGVVRFIAQLVNQQVRTVAESRRRGIYCGFTIFLDAVRPVGLAVV